jgi:hypothetical protein
MSSELHLRRRHECAVFHSPELAPFALSFTRSSFGAPGQVVRWSCRATLIDDELRVESALTERLGSRQLPMRSGCSWPKPCPETSPELHNSELTRARGRSPEMALQSLNTPSCASTEAKRRGSNPFWRFCAPPSAASASWTRAAERSGCGVWSQDQQQICFVLFHIAGRCRPTGRRENGGILGVHTFKSVRCCNGSERADELGGRIGVTELTLSVGGGKPKIASAVNRMER